MWSAAWSAGMKCRGDDPVRPEGGVPGTSPLRPAWEPASVTGLAGQYRHFRRRFPDACILLQVGKHHWVADEQRALLAGLRRVRVVTRPGLGPGHELPPAALKVLRRRLRRAGRAHLRVAQTGHFRTGFKRRAWVLYWRPAPDPTNPFLMDHSLNPPRSP